MMNRKVLKDLKMSSEGYLQLLLISDNHCRPKQPSIYMTFKIKVKLYAYLFSILVFRSQQGSVFEYALDNMNLNSYVVK